MRSFGETCIRKVGECWIGWADSGQVYEKNILGMREGEREVTVCL